MSWLRSRCLLSVWNRSIADGKLGYITKCLDLEIIPEISVEQVDERYSVSLRTAKGTWCEAFVQPTGSLTHVAQCNE
jgi:hypothetical protein